MPMEYLFDFGTNKIKLCLITNNKWVQLGPGKQWLPQEIAEHAYLTQTKFKPLEQREVAVSSSMPVISAVGNVIVNPIKTVPTNSSTPVVASSETVAVNPDPVVTNDGTPVEAMPVETPSNVSETDTSARTRTRART